MFLFCFAASTCFYIRISRVIVLHHMRDVYTNNLSSKAQMSVTKVMQSQSQQCHNMHLWSVLANFL